MTRKRSSNPGSTVPAHHPLPHCRHHCQSYAVLGCGGCCCCYLGHWLLSLEHYDRPLRTQSRHRRHWPEERGCTCASIHRIFLLPSCFQTHVPVWFVSRSVGKKRNKTHQTQKQTNMSCSLKSNVGTCTTTTNKFKNKKKASPQTQHSTANQPGLWQSEQ